jgi:hypothetical protein
LFVEVSRLVPSLVIPAKTNTAIFRAGWHGRVAHTNFFKIKAVNGQNNPEKSPGHEGQQIILRGIEVRGGRSTVLSR